MDPPSLLLPSLVSSSWPLHYAFPSSPRSESSRCNLSSHHPLPARTPTSSPILLPYLKGLTDCFQHRKWLIHKLLTARAQASERPGPCRKPKVRLKEQARALSLPSFDTLCGDSLGHEKVSAQQDPQSSDVYPVLPCLGITVPTMSQAEAIAAQYPTSNREDADNVVVPSSQSSADRKEVPSDIDIAQSRPSDSVLALCEAINRPEAPECAHQPNHRLLPLLGVATHPAGSNDQPPRGA